MFYIVVTSANLVIVAFVLGYRFQSLQKRVEVVEEAIKQKIDKPIEAEEESPSSIIDPYDSVQTAIYEANKERERLNAIK